jgi:hypothetical protein
MTQSALAAIILVAVVAVFGVLLRRMSGPSAAQAPSLPALEPEVDETDLEAETAEDDATVALTSDGWAFVPVADRDRIRLVPPRDAEGATPAAGRPTAETLGRGDLIAARVTRGAPDHDPWRLEGLGRDHEYRAWRFETEEAARAALVLVERSVVRSPHDADGETLTVTEVDFDRARRREEEIEAELATMAEDATPEDEARREPIG